MVLNKHISMQNGDILAFSNNSAPDGSIETLPNEILQNVFCAITDLITVLHTSIVSMRWKYVCADTPFEFGRLPEHKAATLKDGVLISIAQRFPSMLAIDLSSCKNLTDAGVAALAERCPNLTHVIFRLCENLTDASVATLAERCPNLTHVNFRLCRNLTDASVATLAERRRNLTHLEFVFCEQFTDAAVVALAANCRGLTHVNFSLCKSLPMML